MPTVSQFGFSTGSGVLANMVDGNPAVGWAPLADTFDAYTAPFLTFDGQPNVGFSFPAIQFDFGEAVRAAFFLLQVETPHTLGPAILIGSDNPATSVANTIQAGDVLLGSYTAAQITGGQVLETLANLNDIRKRYLRLLQRKQD
jgi:hypothetical protein